MNQGEGVMLEDELAALGYQVVNDPAIADLVVLNTCTVIQETEARMLRRMEEMSTQRKHLIVSGCMAAVQTDDIVKRAPNALIIAPRDYSSFSKLIEENFGRSSDIIPVLRSDVTATVPIAQGCMGACSYCITRKARGTLLSYPLESIVGAARAKVKEGSKELLITSQDTACYGFDIGKDLGDVLDAVRGIEGDFMVRVGMMNPDNLSKVIDKFAIAWNTPKIYHFVHLPVQTGSDGLLRSMNRKYTVKGFESLVEKLRSVCPRMALATDIITGYPGETDDDHQSTIRLLQRVRPDTVNITRFSPRPGTSAAYAKDQVAGWRSKDRSRELTSLRFEIASSIHEAMIGEHMSLLITEVGKKGTMIGRTPEYRQVIVPGGVMLGEVHEVEITSIAPTHMFGKVL